MESDKRTVIFDAVRIAQLEGDLSDALTDLNTARQDNASCAAHIHNQASRIDQLKAALHRARPFVIACMYRTDGPAENVFEVIDAIDTAIRTLPPPPAGEPSDE